MKNKIKKERLIVLDILRIVLVLIVFLFHSNIHLDCEYSFLTPFISMGAIAMTGFFILSGFSLFYINNENSDFNDSLSIKSFYRKRLLGIFPIYWFIVIVYPFWDIVINKGSIITNIILFPIEALGLQSVFHTLFSFSHNNGTWFVSCILFCYLSFPLFFKLIIHMETKFKIILGIIFSSILLYSPLLVGYLKIESIYENCFFRILEFLIGVLLCSLWFEFKDKEIYQKFAKTYTLLLSVLILLLGVTVGVNKSLFIGNYMLYSWIGLPCFCFIIFLGAGIKSSLEHSQLIKYLVEISYAFFFAQFFTWKISLLIINTIGINTNSSRIVISMVICIVISIILHELIEKLIRNLLVKYFFKEISSY